MVVKTQCEINIRTYPFDSQVRFRVKNFRFRQRMIKRTTKNVLVILFISVFAAIIVF